MLSQTRRVAVFGATGSIGASTLDVIARHPHRYQATVLAAAARCGLLASCRQHRPAHAVIADEALFTELRDGPAAGCPPRRMPAMPRWTSWPPVTPATPWSPRSLAQPGCLSTLAAAAAGKRILLANKGITGTGR